MLINLDPIYGLTSKVVIDAKLFRSDQFKLVNFIFIPNVPKLIFNALQRKSCRFEYLVDTIHRNSKFF